MKKFVSLIIIIFCMVMLSACGKNVTEYRSDILSNDQASEFLMTKKITNRYTYEYEYDDYGNVISEVEIENDSQEKNTTTAQYEYDSAGRVLKKNELKNGEPSWSYEYYYDKNGFLVKEIQNNDWLNNEINTNPDWAGIEPVEIVIHYFNNENGSPLYMSTGDGLYYTYEYENDILIKSYRYHAQMLEDNIKAYVDEFIYNKYGDVVKAVRYEDGILDDSDSAFNNLYNRTYEYEFDKNENIIKKISRPSNTNSKYGASSIVEEYEYSQVKLKDIGNEPPKNPGEQIYQNYALEAEYLFNEAIDCIENRSYTLGEEYLRFSNNALVVENQDNHYLITFFAERKPYGAYKAYWERLFCILYADFEYSEGNIATANVVPVEYVYGNMDGNFLYCPSDDESLTLEHIEDFKEINRWGEKPITSWKDAYAEILKNTIDEYPQYQNTCDYSTHDIDKDGTPELIVKVGTCEADYEYRCYGYYDDRKEAYQFNTLSGGHAFLAGLENESAFLIISEYQDYGTVTKCTYRYTMSYAETISSGNIQEYHSYSALPTYELDDKTGLEWTSNNSQGIPELSNDNAYLVAWAENMGLSLWPDDENRAQSDRIMKEY